MTDELKVVYLAGSQRGGTTIAGRLVGTLPTVAFAGEVRRLWEKGWGPGRRCGCGELLDDCPVWSRVKAATLRPGVTPEVIAGWQETVAPVHGSWWAARGAVRRKSGDATLDRYSTIMVATHRALAEAYAARVVVDSSKLPADIAVLARARGLRPYLLHLVRDSRGVVCSQLRRSTGGSRRYLAAGRGASAWALRHATITRVAHSMDLPYLQVRYEDLMSDPVAVLGGIAAFIGERLPDPTPAPPFDLSLVHTPEGPLPAQAAVALERDDRWHTELDVANRAIITSVSAPWLVRYGYPLWNGRPRRSLSRCSDFLESAPGDRRGRRQRRARLLSSSGDPALFDSGGGRAHQQEGDEERDLAVFPGQAVGTEEPNQVRRPPRAFELTIHMEETTGGKGEHQ
jgi:hypothetical protein